jgi:hypothetical protein
MHPTFRILPLCTLCLGLGLGLAWFGSRNAPPSATPAPSAALPAPRADPLAPAAPSPEGRSPAAPPAEAAPEKPTDSPDTGQDAAPLLADEARTRLFADIEAAYTTYDPAALPRLEPRLRHSDPAVRAYAREAIVQLGHADGAPLLRTAARSARDPKEAIALLEAAEFLELPPAAPVAAMPVPPAAGHAPTRKARGL